MPVQRPFLLYLRSRLNLALSVGGALLIALSLVFLRPFIVVPILVILLAWAGLTVALFFSRRGAQQVVAESDEDQKKAIQAKIRRYAEIRERISVLRLGDDRMAKAIEYFLLQSGAYLEKCRELTLISPFANERIERVLEICQVYLGERDESATEKRYSAPQGDAQADPAETLAKDIIDCGNEIKSRITEDLLGISGEERLSIMKELEEKK
ncbi:MAG: hypothetical protein ABSG63_11705 [Spirochaetia bacterium]|jgi:hypothetical protein